MEGIIGGIMEGYKGLGPIQSARLFEVGLPITSKSR